MKWLKKLSPLFRPTVESALSKLGAKDTPFFFVQVGSSDGTLNDPLREYILAKRAVGIFIEPLPDVFARLAASYSGFSDLHFFNCAIGPENCPGKLFIIGGDQTGLPDWAYQVASFDRQVLLNHAASIPDLAGRIEEVAVDCRRLDWVLAKVNPSRVDCLQIDVEGYDYKILQAFPFERYLPKVVIYEHKHLNLEEYQAALALCRRNGYRTFRTDVDVVALR